MSVLSDTLPALDIQNPCTLRLTPPSMIDVRAIYSVAQPLHLKSEADKTKDLKYSLQELLLGLTLNTSPEMKRDREPRDVV